MFLLKPLSLVTNCLVLFWALGFIRLTETQMFLTISSYYSERLTDYQKNAFIAWNHEEII